MHHATLFLLVLLTACLYANFVYITGNNLHGLLGNGLASTQSRAHAQLMTHPANKVIMRVFAGALNTFFTTHDNELYGFGAGDKGTMGDGNFSHRYVPVKISSPCFDGQEIVQMAISETHVVALTANNTLCHWGSTQHLLVGQVYTGFNNTNVTNVPVKINATSLLPAKIKYICAGNFHTHMVLENDEVYNMGETTYRAAGGQAVNGAAIYKPASTLLQGKSIKQLGCGYNFAVVLTTNGEVYARGWNIYGSIGDNTIVSRDDFTRTLDGNAVLGNVTQIAVGYYHVMAINTLGRVSCWGFNGDSECGNNNTLDQKLPIAPIETLATYTATPIVQVTASMAHSLILSNDNKMYSWGIGGTGALGNSDYSNVAAPLAVNQNVNLAGKTIRNIYSTQRTSIFYAPPSCYGVLATNLQSACSSNGLCVGQDTCACKSTFTGSSCNQCASGYYNYPTCQPGCFGILANNASVCNGRGICVSPDVCSCTTGVSGAQCEGITCFGIASTSLGACNGKGVCTGPDTCTCNTGYFGAQCTLKICNGIGSDSVSVCSGHGACTAPETCLCNTGYNDTYCQNVICPSNCATCSSPTTCTSCKPGYTGTTCQSKLCFGKAETNSTVCSGKGTCTAIDTCTCTQGYTGNECQTPICYSVAASSANVCSGHGTCSAPNTCTCNAGYTTQDCSNPICFQLASSNPNVCSGHGTCSAPDTCTCNTGYGTANCTQKTCFGIPELSPSVCNGRGNCTNINTCSCAAGFSGNQCQTDLNTPVTPKPSASTLVPKTSTKPGTSTKSPTNAANTMSLHVLILILSILLLLP